MLTTVGFILNHPLNQKYKLHALYNYVQWQFRSRLTSDDVKIDWINDSKFYARKGETGLTGNIYTGLHEYKEMLFVLKILKKDDLFIDVGANSGSYTILASKVAGATTKAFEPVKSTFNRLENNISLNAINDRVNAFNIAIGDTKGSCTITNDCDTMNKIVANEELTSNTSICELDKLDNLLVNDNPCVIKIDVEGFEEQVLNGATDTLKKESLKALIVEVNSNNDLNASSSSILDFLMSYNFIPTEYNPFKNKIEVIEDIKSIRGNVIFVKNIEDINARLNNSIKIKINNLTL